ncbi:MAG TPA: hypothetical protein VHA10_09435 [Hypericibacter adhaerens]|jgi:hypothetical protein|uniref:Dihydrodipicolinate reductase n=1 Tax=Hypericibacter adhaerens TaxID=2602016 RepID=A0A5J6MUV7_9PROT|nr:hypothetical protein [Hypericibacter adhaerens]QEX21209.1 hypothetical protein FRZ61_11310 [Hypericibacter adhaerens]HWA43418.1 hypothetical protein [Hypericibacter adhaerens]
MTRLRSALLAGMAVTVFAIPATLQASPKGVQEILMGSEIQRLIVGHTLTGQTLKRGEFSDSYKTDGTFEGAGYSGTWTIQNNALCFEIKGQPDSKGCWQFGRDGNGFQLISEGKIVGAGSTAKANPDDL